MSKTTIILQARTGSKRLPKKILAKIEGKSLIWHVINRLKKVKSVEQIILATTKKTEDDILEKISFDNDISVFRGPSKNVLRRFYQCASKFDADPIIRITGDCPLIDPSLIDEMIIFFKSHDYDYVSNTIKPTYPDGLDVEIFSFKLLEQIEKLALLKSDKEHVTSFVVKNEIHFKIFNFENNEDLSKIRLTVDEKNDLKLVRKIYASMKPNVFFTFDSVIKLLKNNPYFLNINKDISRNEGYIKSLKNDGN